MSEPCFECGQPSDHDHHVVPISRGGTRTVPLCGACHAKAHHRDKNMANRTLTKEALARAKVRGVKLGGSLPQCRNLTQAARERGAARSAAVRKAAAIAAVADLVPEIRAMWETEGLSLRAIADRLNADGQKTCGGKNWSAMAIKRVLDRARAGMPPPNRRRPGPRVEPPAD
jgi:recombinase